MIKNKRRFNKMYKIAKKNHMTLALSLFLLFSFSSTIFAAEIIVGFGYAKPPFVFALSKEDTQEHRGIELQIMAEALAYRNHSMKVNYIPNNELVHNLQDGIIDAAATVSEEGKEGIYYSDEFIYYLNYAVTQPDDIKRISAIEELKGRKVLAWMDAHKDLDSTYQKIIAQMTLYKELASQEDQVLLFLQKNVDTLIIDWHIFSYLARKHGYDPTKYHQYNIFGGKTGYKVGFRDSKIRDDFNEGLAYLKSSGRYKEIYNKLWTIHGDILLSKDERAYLEHKGTLRLCFEPDWMPFEAITEAGKLTGMSSDYLELFTNKIGFEVTLHPTLNWVDSLSAIKKRQCDFMLMAESTRERKGYLDFTTPYIYFPYVLVTKNKQVFIDDFDKVLNKSFSLVEGYSLISAIEAKYPSLDFLEVKNTSQGLQKVEDGEVFGYIGSTAVASRAIQREELNLKISAKLPLNAALTVATRNDELLLHNIFQKAVNSITAEDHKRIQNKWLAMDVQRVIDYTLLYKVVLGSVIFILFILYWYQKLQKAHKSTQNALQQLNETKNKLAQLNNSLEERVEIEVEKNKQHQKMMILQSRHAQMGEILSMIAHQWRHPLNNLSLIIQNSIFKYGVNKLDDDAISKLDIDSSTQIRQMSNTIKEFRSFFQPDNISVKYDINRSIVDALSIVKPMLDAENIDINIETQDNILVVGFPTELGQAIVNILTNSMDALVERNVIKKSIKLSLILICNEVVINIADNGGGVPLEIVDKIFDPYFSTKMDKNGTGLGLYMTKIIVEDHMNGKLSVSNSDNGLVVRIVIPHIK
ncbi:MAG: signal transduction histidine kinase [Sulfurimonas sp.]|jgi:signal transduction histidine kinase